MLVAVVLFGGAWPITKHALRDATPLWFGASRAGLATLVLFGLLALLRRLHLPRRGDWPALLAMGVLQFGGFFMLSHLAVALVPAGRTAVLSNLTLVWLVPLSVFVMGERVSRRRWLATALALAGAAVLVGPWAVNWRDPGAIIGNGMLLGAALCWSLAVLVTRARPPRSPIVELLPFSLLMGALMLAALAILREPGGGIGPGAVWQAAVIGLIASPLGTWGAVEAGMRLPPPVSATGFLLVPVTGVAGAALWLGEPVGWDMWVGGGLILGGIALALRG